MATAGVASMAPKDKNTDLVWIKAATAAGTMIENHPLSKPPRVNGSSPFVSGTSGGKTILPTRKICIERDCCSCRKNRYRVLSWLGLGCYVCAWCVNANAGIDPVMSHSCVGDSWLLHKPQARRRLPKESFLQKVPLCAV